MPLVRPVILDLLDLFFAFQIFAIFTHFRLELSNAVRRIHHVNSIQYGGIVNILDVLLKEFLLHEIVVFLSQIS